jgi:hypothetical protein
LRPNSSKCATAPIAASTNDDEPGHLHAAVGFNLLWILGNAKARGVLADIRLDRKTLHAMAAFVDAAAGLINDIRPVDDGATPSP